MSVNWFYRDSHTEALQQAFECYSKLLLVIVELLVTPITLITMMIPILFKTRTNCAATGILNPNNPNSPDNPNDLNAIPSYCY